MMIRRELTVISMEKGVGTGLNGGEERFF